VRGVSNYHIWAKNAILCPNMVKLSVEGCLVFINIEVDFL